MRGRSSQIPKTASQKVCLTPTGLVLLTTACRPCLSPPPMPHKSGEGKGSPKKSGLAAPVQID